MPLYQKPKKKKMEPGGGVGDQFSFGDGVSLNLNIEGRLVGQ